MEVIELLSHCKKDLYLEQLQECPWWAGKYLAKMIKNGELLKMCGLDAQVLMLVENDIIISFCTYVFQDEINALDMFPWIGFVYTYPNFRGNYYFKKLLDRIIILAKNENYKELYVSTNEVGLYEKYGFQYLKEMVDITGNPSRIYIRKIG